MGYFRFFYYIAYIFNTVMRIFKRYGKQILWITAIFVFLCLCMYNPKSSAYYLGDDTYTDPNNTIYLAYDSIVLEFLRRYDRALEYETDTTNMTNLEAIKSNIVAGRSIYLYYTINETDDGGLAMINGNPLTHIYLRVMIYRNNNYQYTVNSTTYDDYLGLKTQIFSMTRINSTDSLYYFGTSPLCLDSTIEIGKTFYVPYPLLHYNNKYIYEYFINNKSIEEIELLYEMNSKLDSIEDTMTELPTENSITSDELPTDSGVDTSDLDNGLNGLFGQIAEAFTDIPRSKYNITVPVPFTR